MRRIITIIVIAFAWILSDAFVAHSQSRRGIVTASSMTVTRTKTRVKDPVKIKWQHNIDATVSPTEHYQLTYTGGWRFGNFLFLGFGTGVQVYPNVLPWGESEAYKAEFSVIRNSSYDSDSPNFPDGYYTYEYFYGKYHNPSRIAVPLYLHTKFRFMKTRVAPFLSASGGFMFTGHVDSEGNRSGDDSYYGSFRYDTYYKNGADVVYYADIMFGIDIRFRNESSLTLGLGPIFTGQDDDYPSVYSSEYEDETRAVGGFRLGYSF